jgi:N-acetylglucosamine-6-sulfatase
MRRLLTVAVLLGLLGVGSSLSNVVARETVSGPDQEEPSSSPNILVIVTDDQSKTLFTRALMPNVFSRLVDRGVNFERAYVNTAQCCPSRAQILSGLYGRHSGVDGNQIVLDHPTIVELLKDEGYRTAMTGKYMNSWPCRERAEFDLWACITTAKEHVSLRDPTLRFGSYTRTYRGYQAEVLTMLVRRFIRETPDDQPFFALYAPTSPHMPADDFRYKDLAVPINRPPSFDEPTEESGKPTFMRRGPFSSEEVARIDRVHRKMARSVRALDESIGSLLSSLGDRAANTVVFFLSDNGYLYGEHRTTKKALAYEESVGVPFVVRPVASDESSQGTVSQELVSNVDIAPTIADLVGRQWGADGQSLVPLLDQSAPFVRDAALIEFCQGERFPCPGGNRFGTRRIPSYSGVVTDRYKYVEYYTGETELYDLQADPFELNNLAGDPSNAALVAAMDARLLALTSEPVPETTIVSGPPDVVEAGEAVTFRYFTQHRDGDFECRLTYNDTPASSFPCYPFGRTLFDLAVGDYTFEVQARYEGRTDPTPASRSFTVVPP